MKRTEWYRPDQVPARRGWYERDHRGVREYSHDSDRRITLDLWEPVPPGHCLHPGVWYVSDPAGEINDASQQQLPWRGLKEPACAS